MWMPTPHRPSAYDDDWEDQPGQGPFYQWGLGVVMPLAMIAYGGWGMLRQQISLGMNPSMTFHGLNAVALGIAWIGAAVFVHCHYFWGNVYNQAWFSVLGKIAGGCVFIAGVAVVLVRNGVLGIR